MQHDDDTGLARARAAIAALLLVALFFLAGCAGPERVARTRTVEPVMHIETPIDGSAARSTIELRRVGR